MVKLRAGCLSLILMLASCAAPVPAPAPALVSAPAPMVERLTPQPPAPAGPPASVRSARAHLCEFPTGPSRSRAGAGAPIAMTVSNDGWCSRSMTHNTLAYTGGNVMQQPRHGEARIRHLATRSLIEYRATPGFTGDDSFSVTMLPGNGTYLVDVAVKQ